MVLPIASAILDRPVHTITTSDVERVLRPVWTAKPETARKLHRRLRRVFEHARIRLRDGHGIACRIIRPGGTT